MTAPAPALSTAEMTARLTRCDRCGAKAKFEAILPSGQLLFCAHHAWIHAQAMQDRYPVMPISDK